MTLGIRMTVKKKGNQIPWSYFCVKITVSLKPKDFRIIFILKFYFVFVLITYTET